MFVLQAHGALELSTYCEGYFLQNMAGLVEREAFRALILGSGTRIGKDSLLELLEATLTRRLRSLLVTSRVWETERNERKWTIKKKARWTDWSGALETQALGSCAKCKKVQMTLLNAAVFVWFKLSEPKICKDRV